MIESAEYETKTLYNKRKSGEITEEKFKKQMKDLIK